MPEEIDCPSDVAQWLADFGGYNHFGDPIFRLVWFPSVMDSGPSPNGPWHVEFWAGNRDPIWILQKWMPPEAYGSPEFYNFCMEDGMFNRAMGPAYPEFGRYETVAKFKSVHFDAAENRVIVRTLQLDWDMIAALAQILRTAHELSAAEIAAAKQAEKELIEKAKLDRLADELFDSLPSFYGPVSYRDQITRSALIDREAAKVEAQWKRLGPLFKSGHAPRGLVQKN